MATRQPSLLADQVGSQISHTTNTQKDNQSPGLGSELWNMANSGGGFSIPTIAGAPKFDLANPNTPGEFQVHKPDYNTLQESFDQIMNSYGQFRDVVTAQHETGTQELQSQLDYLLGDIEKSRKQGRQDLSKSRQQLMEQSYDSQRSLANQMSARGLSGSGMEQMGQIQQRMAEGQSLSELANQYYDFEENMTEQISKAQTNYNLSVQKLNDSLQSAMAQILSQEASARMDYNQMVDNLQRQVIADANATLEAQRNYDMQLAQYEFQKAQFQNQMYEFSVQAEFQRASLEAQRAQMAQSARQADRAYKLQLRQYEDAMAQQNKGPGYTDALTVMSNTSLNPSQQSGILQDMGYSKAQADAMIQENRVNEINYYQQQFDDYLKSGGSPDEVAIMKQQLVSQKPYLSSLKTNLASTKTNSTPTPPSRYQSTLANFNNLANREDPRGGPNIVQPSGQYNTQISPEDKKLAERMMGMVK